MYSHYNKTLSFPQCASIYIMLQQDFFAITDAFIDVIHYLIPLN